ncbi:Spy/CpxP family protein refolding chaperone [Mesorhizobium sp. ASY16-5R]|uniref:Spy/CpxP family protein refolding chaperone n=1 Tax=Mesorhizobium sp. ASY16-5R TaxID=3445772 RepID=UPI003FA05075
MTRLVTTTALAFAISVSALLPSLAQPAGGRGMMGGGCPTMGMMGYGMMGRGGWSDDGFGRGMMRGQPRMGAMVDGRLAYLKVELGITDAQTNAWDVYAAAVRARVDLMQDMHSKMFETMQNGSAVERMDARIAGMEKMLDTLKALKPATEELYAVLTGEQKKVADDLIGADCGAM